MHSATLRARGCVRLLRGACAAAERRGRDARRHRQYQTQFPAGDSQSMVTAPPQSCHSVAPRTWHTAGAQSGAGGLALRTHLAHRWCAIWGGRRAHTWRMIQYSDPRGAQSGTEDTIRQPARTHLAHRGCPFYNKKSKSQQLPYFQNCLGYFLRLQHFSIPLLHQ